MTIEDEMRYELAVLVMLHTTALSDAGKQKLEELEDATDA